MSYALLLASCDSPFAPDGAVVARVEATPPSLTLTAGDTRPVTVRVLDDGGATLANRRLFWSSQHPQIATVSPSGLVSGVAPGVTQVAVSVGGKSAIIPVTVNARPVSLVRVTPASLVLIEGAATTLTAQALDAAGDTVPGRPVLWATSDAAVATVTSTGVVSTVAPGTANVTATIDGVVGTAILTVQPVPVASLTLTPPTASLIVGDFLQLTATPRDANGAALAGRSIAWSSSAPSLVSVSSTGVVTALAPGSATITASSEGKSATARVAASLVPVESITLSPGSTTIAAGRTVQLVARVVDAAGTTLTGRAITWSTDQPSIATVDNGGLVTGISTGRAAITASVDGKSATASIDVTPVPVASLTITPGSGTLLVGATMQLTATARDASGGVLPGRNITWISGAPSVATITQGGLLTAVGPGSALIFAAAEGVSASITITVSGIGVAQVRVTPSTTNVQQGKTVQLAAVAYDASGNPLPGRTILWNSGAPTIASVSSSGLVTGIAAGTATITATVDGVAGTATVTVTPTPVASVTVIPATTTLTVGSTLQLTLVIADAGGAPLSPVGRSIVWTPLSAGVATVGASGLVTAVGAGTDTIKVTVDGVLGTAIVTVSSVPVATVTLTPSSASLAVGGTQQLVATARDAGGNILAGRAVTWASSNSTVASVDSTGLVTAVGAGSAQVTAIINGVQGAATISVTAVPIASIVVTPGAASLTQGTSLQLTVAAFDASNLPLTGRTFAFISGAPTIASVSSAGLVTALSPGTARIIVTEVGHSAPADTAVITVSLVPVAKLELQPPTWTASIGTPPTKYFTPLLYDSTLAPLTLTGRTITWASLDPAIATVDASTGFVSTVSVSATPARIVASTVGASGVVADTSLLTVSSVAVARVVIQEGTAATVHLGAPYARTLTAKAYDAGGTELTRSFLWVSMSQQFAQVDASLGIVTGVAQGTSQVIASSGGVADTIAVTVDLVPISPTTTTVILAATQVDSVLPGPASVRNYTAVPRDSAGHVIAEPALGGRLPSWSLPVGAGLATLASSGATATVTPNSPGTVTVRADYGGGVAPAAALRILTPVASIQLTASPDSLFVGSNAALFAAAKDAGGLSIAGRMIQLSSASAPSVITIGATSGTQQLSTSITGVSAPGGRASATITATAPFDGVSNATTVHVLAPVSSIVVTSAADSIYVGGSAQATATLLDAAGDTLRGRPIAWATGSSAIATIAPTGIATGVAAGNTTLIATAEGKSGSRALLVQEPVATVELTAASSSIVAGQTLPTTVTLKDRFGAVITGTRVVGYGSSDTTVARIGTTGVIAAVSVGTASITATSEGKTSPALVITVTPAAVKSVSVAATPYPNVYPGQPPFPATVQAYDASSNLLSLSGRTIVWTSADSTIASVTAGAPGSATIAPLKVGTTTVTASVDGVPATTPITVVVKPVPVASVTVAPASATVQTGQATQFSATAHDSTGATLSGVTFTWSASSAKATVSTSGLATAVDSGTVSIVATATNQGSGGSSPAGSGSLVITLTSIGSITFSPTSLTLPSRNASGTITVSVWSAGSVALTGRTCSIASADTSVFTVTTGATVKTDLNGQIAVGVKGAGLGSAALDVTCDPTSGSPTAASTTVTVP